MVVRELLMVVPGILARCLFDGSCSVDNTLVEELKSPLKVAAPLAKQMFAWTLGNPSELSLGQKEIPVPDRSEVLIRIDAVAICATDLEVIANGPPAVINGTLPFNQGFTPGHEYMGTVSALGPGVDEYKVGERVAGEIHSGPGQCKRSRSAPPPPRP